MSTILELQKISKRIKGRKVLDNIAFKIEQGSIVGFIGNNGAGKTTTMKIIFGETKSDSGNILYFGENIFSNNFLQEISFFPDSNNLPLNFTVKEYLIYISKLLNKNLEEENLIQLIKVFNFENHYNKKIKELSAGLKKKAIMIGCIISNPKLLILDEPTANLDVHSKFEFLNILKLLNEKGITIFLTSHLIEELNDFINYLIIIDKGKIIYESKYNCDIENIKTIYKNNVDSKDLNLDEINKIVEEIKYEN